MTSQVVTIAASLILTATSTSNSMATSAQKPVDPNSAAAVKYCIEYEKIVGSRISQTECRTKKAWADLGIDVDEMLKKEPEGK
jgi:hypothetical protein